MPSFFAQGCAGVVSLFHLPIVAQIINSLMTHKFLNSLCSLTIWISSFVNDYPCLFPFLIISLLYKEFFIFSRSKSFVDFTYIDYLLPLSVLPCYFHDVLL